MYKSILGLSVLISFSLNFIHFAYGAALNIAKPDIHPYVDPSGGRENHDYTDQKVNEARVYDFYQRQADYYMANPDKIPDILPSYPGLDAGLHGHWGKYNQNNHNDGRWNDGDTGEHFAHVVKGKGLNIEKGICVKLGNGHELSACFDPQSLSYRAVWENGWINFQPFRWGSSRGANVDGNIWFSMPKAEMPKGGEYLGLHRFGKRVVFEYQIGNIKILDEPWAGKDAFYRRIDLLNPVSQLSLPCKGIEEAIKVEVLDSKGIEKAEWKEGELVLSNVSLGARLIIRISKGKKPEKVDSVIAHLKSERKVEKRWNDVLKAPGKLGKLNSSQYVVDTLSVPYENPYKTVMQLTSMAFLPNGNALVATLPGDIWLVKGITDDLKQVTWQRYATGFNQPIGIHVDKDGIFVLDRCQISILHDTNGDEEVDHYEKYANDFGGFDRSHTHTFGLHRTKDKSFHFIQWTSVFRTGPDKVTKKIATGVRNCMAVGGSDDYFWAGPQEGTWTPTSAIIEVKDGEEYGLGGKGISPPLCYVPRGIDNSTGGMKEITSDKWGPFKGSHVGLSYGSGTHYLILRDATSSRPQGAVVPLKGNFLAGVMRGDFHPKDGQLYVAGLDGWGDYSIKDGCLHRVRYTGGKVRKPKGFKVHSNGIRIDFTTSLDSQAISNVENYFAHAWNYEYAKRYGSPEFSAKVPESLGHDRVNIRSVKLLEDGKSIFVEMPDLEPIMQLHIRMHIKDADGTDFKTDFFCSPMFPDKPYISNGLINPRKDKLSFVSLRVANQENKKKPDYTGETIEGEREIRIDAINGLKYSKALIEAKSNEALVLKLKNIDAMPHNLVIIKPGSTQKVGEASFKMISDPKAGEKNYAPDLNEVLHIIPVIEPGKTHALHFRAPKEPGDYPYICTFPGHWMAMQGVLRVK
jgi:azurin